MTIDIEQFRLPQHKHSQKSLPAMLPKKSKAIAGRFIKGPIPLQWIIKAAELGGRTMNIAMALWYLSGLKKSATVSLTHKTLDEFGVTRKTASRLLEGMQSHGLITIMRKPGCAPVITILAIADDNHPGTAISPQI